VILKLIPQQTEFWTYQQLARRINPCRIVIRSAAKILINQKITIVGPIGKIVDYHDVARPRPHALFVGTIEFIVINNRDIKCLNF